MYFSFQHEINDKLWEVISINYEKENFTGAILDAVFYLSELVRERTDIELDGVSLVGKAFGGEEPLLKINAFKTESDKNQQKGIESILRGIFQAIRNPRAHEKITDDKLTCDSIMVFISYLVNIIEKAKSKFDFEDFCNRVFDPDFVESEEYAELLVSEIPENKVYESLMYLFNNREKGNPHKFYYIINSFLTKISEDKVKEFIGTSSEILKISDKDHDFRIITSIFRNEKWKEIDLLARIRAENKLIKEFSKGSYNSKDNKFYLGSLGTWLIFIIDHLHLKDKFESSLIQKLSSEIYEELEYVFRHFKKHMQRFEKEPNPSFISAINNGLKRGDKRFYDLVEFEVEFLGSDWTKKIEQNYKNFEERDLWPYYCDGEDEIPF